MKECRYIHELFFTGPDGELSPADQQRLTRHLESCAGCRAAYNRQKQFNQGLAGLATGAEMVEASIDWTEQAHAIHRYVKSRTRGRVQSRVPAWKILVPIAAAVFILGVGLGYLIFSPVTVKSPLPGFSSAPQVSWSLLQATLGKRELNSYMTNAQILLTDLMRSCDPDSGRVDLDRLNRDRVRAMLQQSRYFDDYLQDPRLMSARGLLKQIDWLLYEILALDDGASCEQVARLQDYVRRERLLFKIRLIGKDIVYSEV